MVLASTGLTTFKTYYFATGAKISFSSHYCHVWWRRGYG